MNSMKNVAVVVAGGSGTRMGQDIPKQFINVFDKPVLIYTLESFQRHPDVDAIAVVCIDGWQTMVDAYAKQFNIDKLQWIVPDGGSVQESIRNGVEHLEHELDPEDIVIIHDGIRPLIDADVLTDVIQVCERYGNAVTSLPYNEQIFVINQDDPSTTVQYVPREQLRRVSTPQAYRYGKLLAAYRKAFKGEHRHPRFQLHQHHDGRFRRNPAFRQRFGQEHQAHHQRRSGIVQGLHHGG